MLAKSMLTQCLHGCAESALIPLWNGSYWQLVAVGHAGCSQPANAAIQTAIPGLSAVGDGTQSQARECSSCHGCTWSSKCSHSQSSCHWQSSDMVTFGTSWPVPFDQIKTTVCSIFNKVRHMRQNEKRVLLKTLVTLASEAVSNPEATCPSTHSCYAAAAASKHL